MCLCGDVLYIQIKKWYVKFGATGSLNAGYDTLAYLKHISGTISTQSSLFTS